MSSHYIKNQVSAFEPYTATNFFFGVLTTAGCAATCWATYQLSDRGDPARSFIKWLKISLAVYTLCIVSYTVSGGLTFGTYETVKFQGLSDISTALMAQRYFNAIAAISQNVTQVTLFMTFFHLGADILRMCNGPSARINYVLRYFTYAVCAILVAFALTNFGIICSVFSFATSDKMPSNAEQQVLTQSRFSFSWTILAFVASMANMSYCTIIAAKSRSGFSRTACVYMLVSGFLLIVQTIYDLTLYSIYTDPNGASKKHAAMYLFVLDYFFSIWPLFIIIILFTFLAKRNVDGVASSDATSDISEKQPKNDSQA